MRILAFIVVALGVLGIVISLPILGLAALGHLGALADVGPAENRSMGMQLLLLGLPPLIGGVVLCALGLLALAWSRRGKAAEPGTSPNGGPTRQTGSSAATAGPATAAERRR